MPEGGEQPSHEIVPAGETVEETARRILKEEIERSKDIKGRVTDLAKTIGALTEAIGVVVVEERKKRDKNVS
jgi:ADP-ribose pyrophosphatase YjhB (NUDIX family)